MTTLIVVRQDKKKYTEFSSYQSKMYLLAVLDVGFEILS